MGVHVKGFNNLESSLKQGMTITNCHFPTSDEIEEIKRVRQDGPIKGLADIDPRMRRAKEASLDPDELDKLKKEAIKKAFNLTHGPGKRKRKKGRK